MTTALSRHSAAYKNLACWNVSILELRVVSYWERRWALKVGKPATMGREEFKRHVEHFIEVEFEGSEFRWSSTNVDPQKVAFCSFKSFAL